MMPPTSIDGTDIAGATIDGQDVEEITVDGQTVFTAAPQIGTTVSRPPDDSSFGNSKEGGNVVNPNTALQGVRSKLSQNVGGVTKAFLEEVGSSTVLTTLDISSLTSGDEFDLLASMSAGIDYAVYVDAEGSNYTVGKDDNSGGHPFTSADIDITSSWFNGSVDTNNNGINLISHTALI